MPSYSRLELDKAARKYGFIRDSFEKVLRITRILGFMNTQEYLKEHFVLKGGTAINLTIFNLPRLSVDIDMDFVPDCSRDDMEASRVKVADLLKTYMETEGYALGSDTRNSYSLDAFHFKYYNSAGNLDMLKIELNYSLRCHLFPATTRPVLTRAFGNAFYVNTLDPMEIFAAKANALVSRAAARDLYDFDNMIAEGMISSDLNLFRKSILFYNSISADSVNETFDSSAIDTITMTKIRRDLLPMLHDRGKFDLESRIRRSRNYLDKLMRLMIDRWGAVQMLQNLEGIGFTVVPFRQGFASMSPPTKELMKLALEKRIAHGGHPVPRWMMDNIYIRTDPAGNIKADKAKSMEKIDGAIAAIMGLDRCIRCGNDNSESVYDTRGFLIL